MADKQQKKEIGTGNQAMLIAVAAAIIVLAAAYVHFGQAATPLPGEKPGSSASQIDSASAKLLLASFDKGAALGGYRFDYTTNENGASSQYELAMDGNSSWVKETADFGSREGFFGKDNESDVLCLSYGGSRLCAVAGNDSDLQGVASDLKTMLPNKEVFLKQKERLRKHIASGAIVFSGEPVAEKVGAFGTKKVSYTLNYRNLTVQQLIAIGVSPNDPTLTSITDQEVAYWIDDESGLVVKSSATWRENLIPNTYRTEYASVETGNVEVPSPAGGVIEAGAFLKFYANAVQDYQAKLVCMASPQPERDSCFKSVAAERNDWEICKKISSEQEYESCTIIVAYNTNNHVLCEKLSLLGDDCYISVASKTGNFELCKNLKNTSLSSSCADAAAAGKKAVEAQDAIDRKRFEASNCKVDSDCRIAGNAGQYCVPSNNTGPFANESSAAFACLRGVPCGCMDGFCGFAKDDPYYACVSRVENKAIEEYINALTSNSTNQTG